MKQTLLINGEDQNSRCRSNYQPTVIEYVKTLVMISVGMVLGGIANAQEPGTLDASFGNGGKTEIKITPSARAFSIAVQQDGRIVTAGSSMAGSAVCRIMPNGSLDPSFSVDGIDTGALND